jgi:ketosteroid isomerase-like protein
MGEEATTMHQGRVLVEQLFHTIDARQWDALPRFFSPEVIYERPGYEPLIGLDQLLHFYRTVRVIASGTHTLEQLVLDDACGACWGRFVGLHKNGSSIDERFADVYTLTGGRIATRRSYFFRPAV